ncbi:MAG: LPS export ABC transporter periplasmic protein LptC [Endozoicomonas sp. (ex Botrylloides leachii)]|nr:LPS export ABC transporter periplasmic protein LptC [Endozoicomonas sp. (ex Botrylloides leachii)]
MLKWNYPITLFLLLVVLSIGYWAYKGSLDTTITATTKPDSHNPDYFLDQATIIKYSHQGTLDYKLSSDNISHYRKNNITLLKHPLMTSYRKSGQVTKAKAVHGKLLSGHNTLVLWDKVVMTQTPDKASEKVRMDTEYLTILSNKSIAETDAPVLISSKNNIVRAIGMQTFYDKGLIQLKSRVRGINEPD